MRTPALSHPAFRLLCTALLLCLGAPAWASQAVPGAAWTLHGEGWTAEERAWIAALSHRLPHAWQAFPAKIERTAAPAGLPLDELHSLVTVRGHHIELATGGLDETDPKLAAALQHQLTHALTHALDAEQGWSRDRLWRGLSGWPLRPWRGVALERDPLAYARPEGMSSAAEDLATVADALLLPDGTVGDDAVPCALPGKTRFLTEQVGLVISPDPGCAPLEAVGLDPDEVAEIDIVYVVATAEAASIGGHMLVAVRSLPDANGNRREDAYGLVADTTGVADGSLRYSLMGISGGFPAQLVLEPMETTFLRYSEGEQRDLRLYRFVTTDAQKRILLARLDEIRQGWDRPYAFFTGNCARLPEELAIAVLGRKFHKARPLSPDVLLANLGRHGLLAEVPPDRLSAWSVTARAQAGMRLSRPAQKRLITDNSADTEALHAAFRQLRDPDALTRAEGYRALEALAPKLSATAQGRTDLLNLLAWRDPQETVAWGLAVARGATGPNPALNPLRAATVAARGAAHPAVEDLGDEALVAVLARDRSQASNHTPFRPVGAWAAAVWAPEGIWMGPGFTTALYDGRTGPGRRFPLGDNPTATLLYEELVVGPAPFRLLSHSVLADALYLPTTSRAWRAGFGVTLGDITVRRDAIGALSHPNLAPTAISGTWLGARGVLGLSQSPRWQRDLRLSVGLALESDGVPTSVLPPLQLAAPLGLEVELGSGRQQRTALRLRTASGPAATWSGDLWWESRAELEAGLRLFEVRDVDVVLSAGGQARVGAPGDPASFREGRGRLGFWLERF